MRFLLRAALLALSVPAALPAVSSGQGYAFVEFSGQFDQCNRASAGDKAAAITSAENALARLPHPRPRPRTDGSQTRSGNQGNQNVELDRDWTAARDLAVGFCLTRREDFRVRALTFLSSWLTNYQPELNPVDKTNLDNLFLAQDLVGRGFTPDLTSRWQAFARALAQRYLKEIDDGAAKDPGRWQGIDLKLATMAAYSLNDADLIAHAQADFVAHLSRSINTDGTIPQAGQRDTTHYLDLDLEPLLTAALSARAHSVNWYALPGANGASLSDALLRLAPGASSAPANVYLYAAALDPKWNDVVSKLNTRPALWQQLMMGMPDATSTIQR